jgi:hypothetical protein
MLEILGGNQEALRIFIGKSQRPHQFDHPFFFRPTGYKINQGIENFLVIPGFQKSKPPVIFVM